MAVPNLLRGTLHWTGYGEEGSLQWYFSGATSKDQATLQAMLDNVDTALSSEESPSGYAALRALLTGQQHIDKISLYQYADDSGPATVVAEKSKTGLAGTATLMHGPLQTSLVVTTETGAAGRRNRGRQYFPAHTFQVNASTGCFDSAVSDQVGECAGQLAGDWQDALRGSPGDDGIRWVVYSRVGHSARVINLLQCDNKADTQRRREKSLLPTYAYVAPHTVPTG